MLLAQHERSIAPRFGVLFGGPGRWGPAPIAAQNDLGTDQRSSPGALDYLLGSSSPTRRTEQTYPGRLQEELGVGGLEPSMEVRCAEHQLFVGSLVNLRCGSLLLSLPTDS